MPNLLPSWVALRTKAPDQTDVFVRLHDILEHNLDAVFPGMEIVDTTLFRVTRDAEVELNEDASDLRQQVAEELRQRRYEPVVRLELQAQPDPWVRELLVAKFELTEEDVYELPGELDYTGLMSVASLPRAELRDLPWDPVEPLMLPDPESDIFAAIRAGDILVHHPYESFDSSVERFIHTAADDSLVRSIKMTVYRVGDDTPFVRSLVRAAESGKQVVCLIEVRARFDEAAQPALGRGAGACRRPCRLRCHRPEDAHEDSPGGPPGGRRSAVLCPHRHGELSRPHSPPVHRPWSFHLQSGPDRRPR